MFFTKNGVVLKRCFKRT